MGRRVESTDDELEIESLREQIESSRLHCETLVRKFEAAKTSTEKTRAAHEYDQALNKTQALLLLLELAERQESRRQGDGKLQHDE
jgi:hypothetical protein